jgi:hypothetical protein
VTSPEGSRLIDLQLGPVARAFVAAGSKQAIARVNQLEARHGAAWPDLWWREVASGSSALTEIQEHIAA